MSSNPQRPDHGPFPPLCQKCAQEPEFVRLVRDRLTAMRRKKISGSTLGGYIKQLDGWLLDLDSVAYVSLQACALINIAATCQMAAEDLGLLPPLPDPRSPIPDPSPQSTDARVLAGAEST